MPNVQNVFILGHAGRDAEIKTNGEKQWASFSIAVTDFPDNNTTWYRCSVWGKAAQRAVEKIKKGDTVMVQGKRCFGKPQKSPSLHDKERVRMIQDLFASKKEVEVRAFDGLLVDFARAQRTNVVIWGLRAISDFEYEFQMALMNRSLAPDIETFFMMPSVNYSFLSSNLVREVAGLGGSVEGLVPGPVARRLRQKLGRSPKSPKFH